MITCGVVMTFLLFALFVYYAIDVVLLVFGAVLAAVFLRGLADPLRKVIKVSETKSVLIVSFLLLLIVAGAISALAPSINEQVQNLRVELPKSAREVGNFVSKNNFGRTILKQLPSADSVMAKIDGGSVLSSVGGFFSSTVGAVGNFFILLLLAIYLATEPRFYADGLTKLFPIGSRPRVRHVLDEIGVTLRWWLIGKTASMIFIGLLTWIGLSIVGVPLALTLGLIAGLLSFVPNFGPIVSALPAILLAFIDSPIKALYVALLFIAIQIVESNLVTPYIERQTVELPPALTVFAQVALSVFLGGVGLVLATPLVAFVVVLVQTVYIEDVLGDRPVETTETEPVEVAADSENEEPTPE